MKKLSIIGAGPGYERAKRDFESGREVWCTSSVFLRLQYMEVWPSLIFQLHDESVFEDFIKPNQSRVMLLKPFSSVPKALVLPVKKLAGRFGEIFTSSVSWMLVYAFDQGYTDITIHGISMDWKSEYARQRDSFFYLLGWMRATGIKIDIDIDSGIFMAKMLYGAKL